MPSTRPGARDARERRRQRDLVRRRPFERQRQQQFQPGGAGLGFGERQLLRVVVDRRVVGAHDVDRAVGEPGAQRRAVARAAQRRHEVALRIEPADVDVAQMQVMHGDVAGDRQPVLLRGAHHRDAVGASTGGTGARARRSRGRARRSSPARSSRPTVGIAGEAEARRDFAVVRDAAAREMRVLRPQPDAVAERRRILHRAQQHLRVGQRRVGLRERDAAGLGELAHLGQLRALRGRR